MGSATVLSGQAKEQDTQSELFIEIGVIETTVRAFPYVNRRYTAGHRESHATMMSNQQRSTNGY